MTAIDQLLQSFGASPTQALGSLFGTNPAEGTESTGEFAAALQAIKPGSFAAPLTGTSSEENDIYAVTAADGTSSVEDIIAQYQGGISAAEGAASPQNAASGQPLVLAEGRSKELLEGIPGLQLTKLSSDQLAKIIETNQSAQALPEIHKPDQNGLFVLTGSLDSNQEQSFHFLSLSELEGFLKEQPANTYTGQAVETPQENTPIDVDAIAAETAAIAQQRVIEGSAQTDADTDEVAAAVKQRIETLPSPTSPLPPSDDPLEPLDDAAIIAAAKDASDKTVKAETLQGRTEEKAVDGHGIQTQQAQQNAGAATQAASNRQPGANSKVNQGATKPASAEQTALKETANDAAPDSASRSVDTPKASTPQASPQNSSPLQNQPPLTPERIAGFNGGTATETFAAGLSGLKGESSFASTFGLLGGKPSPALGAHVAKQVNLQVSRAVRAGQNEFTVRLDPAELGRVQVKMSFIDGKVTTKIIAERPETLELMQREIRGLERAVETGGHKASSEGISFSLDTGDGQSAGKSFAEAVQKERLDDQVKNNRSTAESSTLESSDYLPETDLVALEEILSRVTPETGLDVRI